MIPVVNHGRRTGNPEPGLLRHVLFLVITIPFHLSVGDSLHECCNYDYKLLYILFVLPYNYICTFQIHYGVRSSQCVICKWVPFKVYLD